MSHLAKQAIIIATRELGCQATLGTQTERVLVYCQGIFLYYSLACYRIQQEWVTRMWGMHQGLWGGT